MKTTLYRFYNQEEGLNGVWGWSIEKKYGDFEPFYVEVPDEFSVGETNGGVTAFFKDNNDVSYFLDGGRDSLSLVGGSPVEVIRLKIIGRVGGSYKIKEKRESLGLTQKQFSDLFDPPIPIDTVKGWDSGRRIPPEWLENLIIEKLERVKGP